MRRFKYFLCTLTHNDNCTCEEDNCLNSKGCDRGLPVVYLVLSRFHKWNISMWLHVHIIDNLRFMWFLLPDQTALTHTRQCDWNWRWQQSAERSQTSQTLLSGGWKSSTRLHILSVLLERRENTISCFFFTSVFVLQYSSICKIDTLLLLIARVKCFNKSELQMVTILIILLPKYLISSLSDTTLLLMPLKGNSTNFKSLTVCLGVKLNVIKKKKKKVV